MRNKQATRIKNLTLAGIGALAGVVSLGVIMIALFLGLWLDSRIGRRGPMTILLLVLSVPISLYLMSRIALAAVTRVKVIVAVPTDEESEEEA